jgi:aspartyl-tRNA synthetase
LIGQEITVHGFVGKRRDLSDRLSFVNLSLPDFAGYKEIQIVSQAGPAGQDVTKDRQNVHEKLKGIKPHSAVSLTGVLSLKRRPKGKETPSATEDALSEKDLEIQLRDVQCLASFPDDIIVSDDAQFGPETRHLQMRFDRKLADRIRFRSQLLQAVRQELSDFSEVETPILFKSTPEGAREFLVPTRRPGYSYALPQSPQQYKQILMASGMHRYFQVAKCFRDEDLRADRQPEFTQIDMEMAFAGGEDVMRRIEELVRDLCERLHGRGSILSPPKSPFQRVSYTEAMALYGSDKPDLRIPDAIISVDSILPEALIGMMTSLSNPVINSWKIRLNADTSEVRKFLQEFMDSAEGMEAQKNPDGPPGIFIYDPRKPLEGLQAFGFEGLEAIKDRYIEDYPEDVQEDGEPFTEGDLIILQARPRQRFYGGSTALGRLRTALHKSAVSKGLSPRPTKDEFLWVVDFPLFTPNNGIDPGQGGTAGFSATHHPFTAPKTAEDVDLLLSDPLAVTADHYDLVLNGVELGGGSRRIHNSEMQQFVMRDILKVKPPDPFPQSSAPS